MRATRCYFVTVMVALALAACEPSAKTAGTTGYIQTIDGHQAIVITRGSTTLIVPFDRPPTGTVLVEGNQVRKLGRQQIPMLLLGCPCCVKGCPTCRPGGGVGCYPDVMPDVIDWSGELGEPTPRGPGDEPCRRPPCLPARP